MSRPHMAGVLAVLLSALVTAPASAIVNGAAASEATFASRFPWAVAIEADASDGVCTAQLISPTWILTAAHCTTGSGRVLMGSTSRSRAKVVTVADAHTHPRYDAERGVYDVGLMQLKDPPPTTPVVLAEPSDAEGLFRPDVKAIIAGWGKRSTRLGHSDVFIVSDVELRSLTREDGRFAYFDPVSGPCGGDSGGPLLLSRPDGSWVLAGVASRVLGNPCEQGGGVGIYMDVTTVRDFIEKYVKDLPR